MAGKAKKTKDNGFAALELQAKTAWGKTKQTTIEALANWRELGDALRAVRAEFPDNKAFGAWREKALPEMTNQMVSYAMQFSAKLTEDEGFKAAYESGKFNGIGMPKNAIAKYRFGQKPPATPKDPETPKDKGTSLEDALTMLAKALPIVTAAAVGGNEQAQDRLRVAYGSISDCFKLVKAAEVARKAA
jgi:hypothetical protein